MYDEAAFQSDEEVSEADVGGMQSEDEMPDAAGLPRTHTNPALPGELPPGSHWQDNCLRSRWQVWYETCHKTGAPAGLGPGRCNCAGAALHQSATGSYGEATDAHITQPDSATARARASRWAWNQYVVHGGIPAGAAEASSSAAPPLPRS